MANSYIAAGRYSEHPSYCIKTHAYVCDACGRSFPVGEGAMENHARHAVEEHSREFAYENIPGKWYDRLYETDAWKQHQKVLAENRMLRKAGFKKTPGKWGRMLGEYQKGADFFSRERALKTLES